MFYRIGRAVAVPANDYRATFTRPRPAVIYQVAVLSVHRVATSRLRNAKLPTGIDAGHIWQVEYAWKLLARTPQKNPDISYAIEPYSTTRVPGTRLRIVRGFPGCPSTSTRLAKPGQVFGGCMLVATRHRHGLAYLQLTMQDGLAQTLVRWRVG